MNLEGNYDLAFDMRQSDIHFNDIFVRAGQFARCVHRMFGSSFPNKFSDANTYSRTLKLGFRLQPNCNTNKKRVVCYVKLVGCLEVIQKQIEDVVRATSSNSSNANPE